MLIRRARQPGQQTLYLANDLDYLSGSTMDVNNYTVKTNQRGYVPPATFEGTSENTMTFRVNLVDPAWRILPAALEKYKIIHSDWREYVMFIRDGSTERCISFDERPLLIFQKLKDQGKNPAFLLKRIRDVPSPIDVAQKKHAARKEAPNLSSSSTIRPSGGHGPLSMGPSTFDKGALPTNDNTTFALVIFPYMAEQTDEFDVNVEDTFVIILRARGWWVVQRYAAGMEVLDYDTSKQGWAPAGCFLEIGVNVANAIAEALTPEASDKATLPEAKTPILPCHILSSSSLGIAITDYRKYGEEELDLTNDDVLRVFKRDNHWLYVVKERGDRGWVPVSVFNEDAYASNV